MPKKPKPPTITRKQLRRWRLSHEFTQEQAAALFGITRVAYTRWESGAAAIPVLLGRALKQLQHELKGRSL